MVVEPGTLFPDGVPELTDGVVRLRAHRPQDAARIVEQATDPVSQRWTTVPRPYRITDAHDFLSVIRTGWERGDGQSWAVAAADDPTEQYLGTVDLRPRAPHTAEAGYGLHPGARGRGTMASALRLACQWWFSRGGTRVHWQAERGNFASLRVAWSCGFARHGTVPGLVASGVHRDRAVDAWCASLAAEDVMEPLTPWPDPAVLLTTEGRIRLRPWRDDDITHLDPHSKPAHDMPGRSVLDPDTFAEWLLIRREQMSLGTTISWCIADAETDAALGEVLVFVAHGTVDDDTVELGYHVVPSARRRGVASAATRTVVQHVLAPREDGGLGVRRLVARTAEDNTGSNRVLDALGFTIWGRETAADLLPDGRAVDALHWELLRDA
ncbi:MAG: GNAT family N-acetyltransferase [Dermatophilaceae bacterium]